MNTNIKVEKGQLLTTALTVDPGKGAVDFAMRYVEEMTLSHVVEVCKDLLSGNFEEIDDKKVRRCQYCGYFYRDSTKNNSSLVCSDECKTGKDVVMKAYRRKVASTGKPRRPTYKELYYRGEETGYPHWMNERYMLEYDRKHELYSYGDDLEAVIGREMQKTKMGGKKRSTQAIDYNGDEKGIIPFYVRFPSKKEKDGKVITVKKSPEQIEQDLIARYGEVKLMQECKRAQNFSRNRF